MISPDNLETISGRMSHNILPVSLDLCVTWPIWTTVRYAVRDLRPFCDVFFNQLTKSLLFMHVVLYVYELVTDHIYGNPN